MKTPPPGKLDALGTRYLAGRGCAHTVETIKTHRYKPAPGVFTVFHWRACRTCKRTLYRQDGGPWKRATGGRK